MVMEKAEHVSKRAEAEYGCNTYRRHREPHNLLRLHWAKMSSGTVLTSSVSAEGVSAPSVGRARLLIRLVNNVKVGTGSVENVKRRSGGLLSRCRAVIVVRGSLGWDSAGSGDSEFDAMFQ